MNDSRNTGESGNRARRVVFLACYGVDPDVRIEKEARALYEAGWEVLIVGRDRYGSLAECETREYATVYRLRTNHGRNNALVASAWRMIRWQIALVLWLLRNRRFYSTIHATNLLTVYPALVARLVCRKKVVYDIFDFFADTLPSLSPTIRSMIRRAELWAIDCSDAVILADESRLCQIKGSRPKRTEFIYNSPEFQQLTVDKAADGDHPFRIAYFGCLQVERGLLEMLAVVQKHPEWHMDLGGFESGMGNPITEKALSIPNVEYHGQVPYDYVLAASASADLLFATYSPEVPNHRYSSANKLFEAMMFGKPIIVAKDTGMDSIVAKYNLGRVVEYGDTTELETAISDIAAMTPADRHGFAEHSRETYRQYFNWDIMKERLVALHISI